MIDPRLQAVLAFPTPEGVEVRVAWGTDGFVRVSVISDGAEAGDKWLADALREIVDVIRDAWPVHQPEAHDAPIPGRHWYAGCEPSGDMDHETGQHAGTGPRVNPSTGKCEGCGEAACRICGRESCPDHELRP